VLSCQYILFQTGYVHESDIRMDPKCESSLKTRKGRNNVDVFKFVDTNFRGLMKQCIFVDSLFRGSPVIATTYIIYVCSGCSPGNMYPKPEMSHKIPCLIAV